MWLRVAEVYFQYRLLTQKTRPCRLDDVVDSKEKEGLVPEKRASI